MDLPALATKKKGNVLPAFGGVAPLSTDRSDPLEIAGLLSVNLSPYRYRGARLTGSKNGWFEGGSGAAARLREDMLFFFPREVEGSILLRAPKTRKGERSALNRSRSPT